MINGTMHACDLRRQYSEPVGRQTLSIRFEHRRTCGAEAKAANIECLGRNIRGPQVHVPPSDHITLDHLSVEENETD